MCQFHPYFIKNNKLFMSLVQVNPSFSGSFLRLTLAILQAIFIPVVERQEPLLPASTNIKVRDKAKTKTLCWERERERLMRMQEQSSIPPYPDAVERNRSIDAPSLYIRICHNIDRDLDNKCCSCTSYVKLYSYH